MVVQTCPEATPSRALTSIRTKTVIKHAVHSVGLPLVFKERALRTLSYVDLLGISLRVGAYPIPL